MARHYKVEKEEIIEGARNPCKKVAISLLKRHTALSNPEIGALYKISHSAVTKAHPRLCRQMEEDKRLTKEIAAPEVNLSPVKA